MFASAFGILSSSREKESDDDSLGGVSISDDDDEEEKTETEAENDPAAAWPVPVGANYEPMGDADDQARVSEIHSSEQSSSEVGCDEASQQSADSDEDCPRSDKHAASDAEKDCHGSNKHCSEQSNSEVDCEESSQQSADSDADCPVSDKHAAADAEKDCHGSDHLCWGRGKSTADLGAVCPYESPREDSDSSSSEGDAGDEFAAVVKMSDDEADGVAGVITADDDGGDSDSDSQATLRLGERPKKRAKKVVGEASKAKFSETASRELHNALLDAGHRAVASDCDRPSNPSSVGAVSMRTPPCKSKGLGDLETLTPEPVPFLKKKKTKVSCLEGV